jgi:hypothetical protein
MKEETDAFSNLLKKELQRVVFDLTNEYNVDERRISIVKDTRNIYSQSKRNEASCQTVHSRQRFLNNSSDMHTCWCVFVPMLIVFPAVRL